MRLALGLGGQFGAGKAKGEVTEDPGSLPGGIKYPCAPSRASPTRQLSRAPACFVLLASVRASVIAGRRVHACVPECGSWSLGRLGVGGGEMSLFAAGPSPSLATLQLQLLSKAALPATALASPKAGLARRRCVSGFGQGQRWRLGTK